MLLLRGKRHLEELIKATELGSKSSILFLIFRRKASIFSPNHTTDPKAVKNGLYPNHFKNRIKQRTS